MENIQRTLEIEEWVVRVQEPRGPGPFPIFLLIHGWTGDENVMWIFAQRLPKEAILVAPRGIYPAPAGLGGYGWYPEKAKSWPKVYDLRPAVDGLLSILSPEHFPRADFSELRAVGFSQGTALTYALALLYPEKLRSLAGLSGFMPEDAAEFIHSKPLQGKPVFVAHGTQDSLVPVERARAAVELLQQAGAQVTYCEDDVGHKLSLNCFRGLEAFFEAKLDHQSR